MVHARRAYSGSRIAAVLAGGVFTGVAFPPIGFWPLAWGAMIPLFLSVAVLPRDRAFLYGLVFFLPALGIPHHWVVLHRMATPALVSAVAIIAVAVCAAAMIALFAGSGRDDRPVARIIAAACCLLLFEQVLIYGPVPFPSAALGYAMADAVWLDPVLRAFGVSGVSLVLTGTSAATAALLARRPARRARHVQALLVLASFLAGWIVGPLPPAPPDESSAARPAHDTLRMTLVQPALGPDTWANVTDPERVAALERRLNGLMALLPDVDPGVVVLPETALPTPALRAFGSSPGAWMRRWSNRLDTPLLAGAVTRPPGSHDAFRDPGSVDSDNGEYRNSALLALPRASPEGGNATAAGDDPSAPSDTTVQRYDKQSLVPFAERVPLVDILPFLGALSVPAGGVARYGRGRKASTLSVDGAELGLLICFESLFPQLARHRLTAGADVLVVLTQDGWWRSNAPRRQHLLYSRMRAVETGLPLVQVAVDGESGLFDHRGRLRVLLPSGVPAARTIDIALASGSTLFGTIGDVPLQGFLLLLLIAAAVRLFVSGPARRSTSDFDA